VFGRLGRVTPPPAAAPEEPSRWSRINHHLHRNKAVSATTKVVVTLVGSAVLGAGLIMMVTPGPGLVGIAAGLAILATEWDWADRWLQAARRKLDEAMEGETEEDTRRRRRRALITTVFTVGTVAVITVYVALRDWPAWSVSLWDRAQSVLGFLPELPGM
jgi:uncharacterized protein (TIGR02611 family)